MGFECHFGAHGTHLDNRRGSEFLGFASVLTILLRLNLPRNGCRTLQRADQQTRIASAAPAASFLSANRRLARIGRTA